VVVPHVLSHPRYSASVVQVSNQLITVSGYIKKNGVQKVEAIDLSVISSPNPPAKPWTQLPELPIESEWMSAAVVGGTIYVVGANKDSKAVTVALPPDLKAWTTTGLVGMTQVRYRFASVVLSNRLYVIGGETRPGDKAIGLVEYYSPADNKWNDVTPLLVPRVLPSVTVLDGKIYVCAGIGSDGSYLTSVEVYDPATNQWSASAPMSVARMEPVVAAVAGKLLVAGGCTNKSEFLSQAELFDPKTGKWSAISNLPKPRGMGGCIAV